MLEAEYEMSDAYDDDVDVIVTPEMVRFVWLIKKSFQLYIILYNLYI